MHLERNNRTNTKQLNIILYIIYMSRFASPFANKKPLSQTQGKEAFDILVRKKACCQMQEKPIKVLPFI